MRKFAKHIQCLSAVKPVTLILVLMYANIMTGQHYLPLNSETNLLFEKSNFKNNSFHSNVRPFLLSDSLRWDSILSKKDSRWVNNRLLELGDERFSAHINPIITIEPTFGVDSSQFFGHYQLGVSVAGKLMKKLTYHFDGFYGMSSFEPIQQKTIDSTGIVPHFGKYLSKQGNSYHYLSLTGYVSYSPWKELNLQAGVGKNFFGDGYRSLFLSGNATSYPFVKATVNVRKFKYIWMFGALKDPDLDHFDDKLRNKLLFTHYLSWNATKWFNLNFFESTVSNPVDSMGVTYFNVNYLNPVIFLRPTEFSGGSADNALLGFGAKVKLWQKYQFYGQLIIDEFVLSEIRAGNDWWGNKYGIQAGVKLFDVANIKNLFGRIEYNLVRPYTYSYSNSIINYGSHYQALAHPSGANFEELLVQLHYHKNRYLFEVKGVLSKAGFDSGDVSYGKNIYKSYDLRLADYGNKQGQGLPGKYSDFSARASYFLNPQTGLQINFALNYHQLRLSENKINQMSILFGIRTLIFNNNQDFL